MFSQDDDNHGPILGVVFALVALVLALVIGISIFAKNRSVVPAATQLAGTSAVAPGSAGAPASRMTPAANRDAASVVVQNGVVKFYFATGKSALAPGGSEALSQIVQGTADGKRAVVSGFHDSTGSAASNAELARQRAFAVRDALKALGVADNRIELRRPEQTPDGGSNAEARRVEVAVQ